jgi:pyruvate dehydrogenase (quinone)
MAAFEAVGYAKYTGKVGVCMATSGPGAVHLLNGLYDAKLDHVPVVAIVGQTGQSALGGAYQQEIDLVSLFKDVAGDYLQMVTVPQQLPNVIDRAIRVAQARRAPTCIIIPADVQEMQYTPPAHASKEIPSSRPGTSWPTVSPDAAAVREAAEVLNAGSRVALLVGQGARGARPEVIQVADLLGAGVAKGSPGKGCPPRRPALRYRLDRPARHPAQLRADARLRHPPDRRFELSLLGVSSRAGSGARCRSTSTASSSVCAIRTRSTWSATPRPRSAL